MQQLELTNKTARVAFNSIGDLGEFVAARGNKPLPGTNPYSLNPGRYSQGTPVSFSKAVKIAAREGGRWQEGADKMQPAELPGEILADALPGLPRLETHEAGFRPNVPAYLAGSPKAMYRTMPTEQPNRLLKIGVNIGAAHFYTPDQLLYRGAAILSVLDALQSSGYSVELWACFRVHDRDSGCLVSIETLVKDSTDTWSPDSVAFALANSAFQRCLTWRVVEILATEYQNNAANKMNHSGLGSGNGLDGPEFNAWYRYCGSADQNHWASPAAALRHAVTVAADQLTSQEGDA
jgi:hypothetical protein